MKNILTIIIICIAASTIFPKDFKGAEYRTKSTFTYGRFEARYKSPQKEGVLASFFTYYEGSGTTWNEIDIEIMGRYDNDVQFNAITPGPLNHVRHNYVNFNPHLDYHSYAFEWTPQYVAWFIDGIEVHRQTGAHIQSLTQPQKIMMNIWNPTYVNWAGYWEPNILPAFAFYDWVSYYSYTPGSGTYGTDNNFTHQWKDNFDFFDQNRWAKATHTFNNNNCDFIPENAVFADGKLILCLTDNINIGYVDVKNPFILWARASVNKIKVMFSEELDNVSSQNISNYSLPGVTINSAVLENNEKCVVLDVSGLNLDTSYYLIIYSIKDKWGNVLPVKAVPLTMSDQLSFPIRINIGGTSVLGYLPDKEWNYNVEYGYLDGNAGQFAPNLQINGTEEDSVYRSERNGLVLYKVRVPNGNYNLKLMLSENYFNASGKRIFDIYIENNQYSINDLDLFQSAGAHTAYELWYNNISVEDEILEINFSAEVDYANINGIVIEPGASGILEPDKSSPFFLKVDQNYPNPFNGSTVVNYSLSSEDELKFYVYDLLGRVIYENDLGLVKPGRYEMVLNTHEFKNILSAGVYFYSFKGKNNIQTKKFILLN